jgi:hypothetical protein
MASYTNIDNNSNTKLLSDQYFMQRFQEIYPDLNPDTLEPELFEDMMKNIAKDEYNKLLNVKKQLEQLQETNQTNQTEQTNQEIINENYDMANEIIPEMFVPSNLIYLKGKINNVPVNIMVDTGASCCFTYKSVIERCGVDYLIDKSSKKMIQGVHGIKPSLGMIWFLDIELCVDFTNVDAEINKSNYVSIPIMVDVNDDTEQTQADNLVKDKVKKIKEIVGTNDKVFELEKVNQMCEDMEKSITKYKLELILGINFLKSYRAKIDFGTMTMTLNGDIKIKFK